MHIIKLHSENTSKKELFSAMLETAGKGNALPSDVKKHKAEILSALLAREKMGDTCIAPGIVMAHARIVELKELFLMAAILSPHRKWEGENQVKLVFMLLIPSVLDAKGVEQSRRLMHLLADDAACANMVKADTSAELQDILA